MVHVEEELFVNESMPYFCGQELDDQGVWTQ